MTTRTISLILTGVLWTTLGGQSTYISTSMPSKAEYKLRQVLSKIAPLEKWDSSWTDSGPKLCWRFFRPDPQLFNSLLHEIGSFQGHNRWHFPENCLEPVGGKTFAPAEIEVKSHSYLSRNLRDVSSNDAETDLLALADQIEKKLHLSERDPIPFSQELLTSRIGLRQSRTPFQDFEERGELAVILIVNPTNRDALSQKPGDILLHFAPDDAELTAILNEILGVDLTLGRGRALTDDEAEVIRTRFPTLWKISDYYADSYLSPSDAKLLYEECERLYDSAASEKALRGLDKLIRIGYWASTKNYGVLFSAP